MTKEEHDKLYELWGALFNPVSSTSPYAPPGEGEVHKTKDFIRTIDGFVHGAMEVEHGAIVLGIPKDVRLVYAAMSYDDKEKADRAKRAWSRIPSQYKLEAGVGVS
jgi:hypothetical protein